MKEVTKVANLKAGLKETIRWYLKFTQPVNKLKDREIDVLTLIIYFYHISNQKDEHDKWAEVFNYDSKIKIRELLKLKNEYVFNNYLTALRKKGAIKNNRVVPAFNPNLEKDTEKFRIVINFDIFK